MPKRTRALNIVIAGVLAACGGSGPTPLGAASPSPGSDTGEVSPSALATTSATPSGASASAFPTIFGAELAPGRYSSSPPFDIPFRFDITETGWKSGHLDAEFFDIQQFDEGNTTVLPSRWIAFAHPVWIRSDAEIPSKGLTAEAATRAWTGRSDLTVSAASPFSFDGHPGLRVDVHADKSDTQLFGGSGGAFGLGPEHDARLGIVPLDGELLLVLVLASRAELEHAWQIAGPILESVDL